MGSPAMPDEDDATREPLTPGIRVEPPVIDETVSLISDATGNARYRILSHLASADPGGQGEVFVALDTHLNREVVLKKLKGEGGDEQARQRFVREIRLGAVLEHPGILPVYDICTAPGGGWFGVYRYLPNGSLLRLVKAYHRDHPATADEVAFRSLLVHFVTACRAVDYAHDRKVVHLDLKPQNIVIGRFGETQVIDWGMAWLQGDDIRRQVVEGSGAVSGSGAMIPEIDVSQPSGFRGTRAYASPEQHERRWERIGPLSDVYGLGATLATILTGQAPFNGKAPTLLEDVRFGLHHHEAKSWVPRALVAIQKRAMAPDPGARYPSAAALADDVERFLADEAVRSFVDPPSVRAWRFVKRHRSLVAAGVALLASSALAFGIGYVAVSRERDVANGLRDVANDERDRANRERDRARDAEAEAQRQERLARENAAATRGVIAGFIDKVADERWAAIPGTAELRLEAVQQVLEEFPGIIAQQPDDADLRFDAARLDRSCANLYRTLGRHDEAERLYTSSRRAIDDLIARHPEDGRFLGERAELLIDIAEALKFTIGPENALTTFREALADAATGPAARPDDLVDLQTLARARCDLADALVDAGHVTEALTLARQSVEGYARINRDNGSWDEGQRITARLLEAVASSVAARAAIEAGDIDTATAMARSAEATAAAIASLSEELAADPNVGVVRAGALLLLGRILSRDADTRAEAAEASARSLGMLRGLVAGSGNVARFRPVLAEVLCDRSESLLAEGNVGSAGECADEAIDVIKPVDAQEQAFEAKRHLARAHALRGRAARAATDPVTARDHLRNARLAYDAAIMGAPSNERLREEAALVERLLAE